MADVFGYTRQVKENELISSDFASIDLGNGRLGVCQSVQGSYNHKVDTIFETGSNALYFVNGRPMGAIQVARMVGKEGFLSSILSGAPACGSLTKITVSLDGDGDQCAVSGSSAMKFDGCKIQTYGFQFGTNSMTLSENASFICASLTRA